MYVRVFRVVCRCCKAGFRRRSNTNKLKTKM